MRALRPSLAGAFALAAAACSGASAEGDVTADEELREAKLEVVARAELPIVEVSGLGRRTLSGKPSYLAVSDAEPALVTFDVDERGRPSRTSKHDLSALFGRGAPQWEAVAGDASGSVFLLSEGSDRITVVSSDLKRIGHTIQLTVPKRHALSDAWKGDANSHGEGMLLLGNGHILVVKEKDPVALIEFAVEGETAQGYDAALALGERAFALPRGGSSTMTPVRHWLVKDSQLAAVSDVSELAVDTDGRLLLLTDQGRAVVRVERGLRPDEDKMDLKGLYKLPSSVDKPEGLVLAGGIPLVAVDQSGGRESLFTLAPLP